MFRQGWVTSRGMRSTVHRVYLLAGGPRDGQLVDALPVDYQLTEGRAAEVPLFDGFSAQRSEWVWADAHRLEAWLAGEA